MTTSISVRLRDPNHPSGKRKRAGFEFDSTAQTIEVTDEQLEILESDPALKIETPKKEKPTKKEKVKKPSPKKTNSIED